MITTETKDSQEQFQQYLKDALDEISTYLQIENAYGEYSSSSPPKLTKIAILVSPFFHGTLDISQWVLQIHTPYALHIQTYNRSIANLDSYTVFTHPLWDNLQTNTFGVISIQDLDNSLTKHHVFTDTTDQAFIIILLEESNGILKGEHVTIALTPGSGIKKTIEFTAPLPIRSIVSLL